MKIYNNPHATHPEALITKYGLTFYGLHKSSRQHVPRLAQLIDTSINRSINITKIIIVTDLQINLCYISIFILSIRTPQLLTIVVLKFEQVQFTIQ